MGILNRLISLFRSAGHAQQGNRRQAPRQEQPIIRDAPDRGQVVRKDDLGSIEAQGIRLQASIEVRKFTEEETRANAQENRWYFEPAFWQVAKAIQAPKAALDALLPELLIAHTAGDPRREQQAVSQHLPEGTWRWPAYEDFVLERDREAFAEELEEIKSSNLSRLLNSLTIPELRSVYKQHCAGKAKSPGKKKADIITAIVESMDETTAATVAGTLRSRLIEDLDETAGADHREMCSVFARKVTMVAYGLRHRKQMLELKEIHPLWRFVADEREGMPKQCRKLHGKTIRYDDPFWQTNYPPCEWPECSCRVELKMRR